MKKLGVRIFAILCFMFVLFYVGVIFYQAFDNGNLVGITGNVVQDFSLNGYDFGGVFGEASASYSNPATGSKNCPVGYNGKLIFGTTNVDYPFYFCYRNYTGTGLYDFGGMYSGPLNYDNPAIGDVAFDIEGAYQFNPVDGGGRHGQDLFHIAHGNPVNQDQRVETGKIIVFGQESELFSSLDFSHFHDGR